MDFYMEASREIVNTFYRRREASEDYTVRVEFEPNPLNFDGIDEVSACVVKKERVAGSPFNAPKVETVVLRSEVHFTIEEAMANLADLVRRAPGAG